MLYLKFSAYKEDLALLEKPEEFLKRVISVPNYSLRVDSVLLKSEFSIEAPHIVESMRCFIKAIEGDSKL